MSFAAVVVSLLLTGTDAFRLGICLHLRDLSRQVVGNNVKRTMDYTWNADFPDAVFADLGRMQYMQKCFATWQQRAINCRGTLCGFRTRIRIGPYTKLRQFKVVVYKRDQDVPRELPLRIHVS